MTVGPRSTAQNKRYSTVLATSFGSPHSVGNRADFSAELKQSPSDYAKVYFDIRDGN
jgi:hypothetical protein